MAKRAQVHRFHDCVAAYLGNGETVYLTPMDAIVLAESLMACANDIKARRFGGSSISTIEMRLEDTGHNGTAYTQKREAT